MGDVLTVIAVLVPHKLSLFMAVWSSGEFNQLSFFM